MKKNKCQGLLDLVSFVQFKKHEKHPWKSVTFSKVAGDITPIFDIDYTFGYLLFFIQFSQTTSLPK